MCVAHFEVDSVVSAIVILFSLLPSCSPACLEKWEFEVPLDISGFSFILLFVVCVKTLLSSILSPCVCYVALCSILYMVLFTIYQSLPWEQSLSGIYGSS